jgi:Flp pilus assembly protein CpaB
MNNRIYAHVLHYRRVISTGLAGVAALLAISLVQPGGAPTSLVSVAIRDLPAGSTLTEDDLKQVEFVSDQQWNGLSDKPDALLGRVLAHSLAANQPVTDSDLVGPHLLDGLDPSFVAVSIPIGNGSTRQLLHTGDFVDIFGLATDYASPAVLVAHRALVLAIPTSQSKGMLSAPSQSESIIVAVASTEAGLVAGHMGSGQFTYALLSNS